MKIPGILLLLFLFYQASAEDDIPFSSAAKLDLALPVRGPKYKLDVLDDARVVEDVIDPFQIHRNREGDIVQRVRPRKNLVVVGIGLALRVNSTSRLPEIVAVSPNSPAAAAGLSSGDIIYMVDGISTEGRYLESTIDLIRGLEDTIIRLQIGRKRQGPPMELELVRNAVVQSDAPTTILVYHHYYSGLASYSVKASRVDGVCKFTAVSSTVTGAGELSDTLDPALFAKLLGGAKALIAARNTQSAPDEGERHVLEITVRDRYSPKYDKLVIADSDTSEALRAWSELLDRFTRR